MSSSHTRTSHTDTHTHTQTHTHTTPRAPRAGRPRGRRVLAGLVGAVGATALLAGCALGSNETNAPGATNSTATSSGQAGCANGETVTVVAHDSFQFSKEQRAAFTKASGCKLKITQSGDAGALTNRLVLTKNSPLGDVVFGIDNAFAGRALKEDVIAPATIDVPPAAAAHNLADGADRLFPIDYGDVCVNIDDTWFAKNSVPVPTTLQDLTKPAYKDLFVTPGAATSSPGLAFLLATIGDRGQDGWQQYWRDLMANGAKVTSGWTDAYTVDFTAGGGKGTRPIVLSYASSPPFTIPEGATKPTTSALLDTCFRQVEYAGVLTGASNPDGARAFIDYLLTDDVQKAIPESMYMYPVTDVALPKAWAKWAKVAPKPIPVDPQTIEANRDTWLKEWSNLTS
ncbi:thiamine ABC transporter substrate-binding protein [Kribbia dieselivorans]|uniref:thiamine ABC transporter substrate-binding protein n=1 Tax=Kribbia dieselivorans TaxID=331526 RepID=UPI0009FB8773|nr:thiamine ABC transporter substrate-binding protein [Kribbia dieselivorans]